MYGTSPVGREMRLLKSCSSNRTDGQSGQFIHRFPRFGSQSRHKYYTEIIVLELVLIGTGCRASFVDAEEEEQEEEKEEEDEEEEE
jgi:hypothetical protein